LEKPKDSKIQIDLALSGSGVRLGGHIGGLLALQELNFEPVRVVATSGGAIIGGFYAAGFDPKKIRDIFWELDLSKLKAFAPWLLLTKRAIFSYAKLKQFLFSFIGNKTLAELPLYLGTVAYDTKSDSEILLDKFSCGSVKAVDAILASACIPYYFGSIKMRHPTTGQVWKLTDGGIINNYPISILKSNRRLIGLWIQGKGQEKEKHWWDIFQYDKSIIGALLDTSSHKHIKSNYWEQTVPIIIKDISAIDFNLTKKQKEQMMQIGYEAVMNKFKGNQ